MTEKLFQGLELNFLCGKLGYLGPDCTPCDDNAYCGTFT